MSDYDLIIRGGSVVRPEGVAKLDIGVKDGVITSLGNAVFGSTESDLDATKFFLFPGGIDPHVHFNEPGRTDWEGFATGTRALAAGGVTGYFDMPLNAQPPVLDKESFLSKWNAAKANSMVDFGLWGALCPGNLTHLQDLSDCGVVGFKAFMSSSGVDDFPLADDGTLLEGMRRACDLEQIVAVHAENEGITARLARQAVAEGRLSAADYLASRPVIAELEAIQRAIFLAWEADCALHVVHVSTARGIELIAGAKAQGLNVSCETAPHYLILTDADAERLGPLAKCAPPLRTKGELLALWEQVQAGNVDMIASDHSPSSPDRKFRGVTKKDHFAAWGGIAGCQTTLPLMLTAVQDPDHPVALERLSEMLSTHVAKRFRLHPGKGEITPGADADLVIVNLDAGDEIRQESLLYQHPSHSPYIGRTTHGRILRTILRGETIYKDGRVIGRPGGGRLLRPAENPPEMAEEAPFEADAEAVS